MPPILGAGPGGQTLTSEWRRVRIAVDLYADELGPSNAGEIYLHVQRDTTSAFSGNEVTVARGKIQRTLKNYKHFADQSDPSDPPLDTILTDYVWDTNVSNGTRHYRARWERWQNGRMVDSSDWNASSSIVVSGAAAGGFTGTYAPVGFTNRFGVRLILAGRDNSQAGKDADSLTVGALDGVSAWVDRAEAVLSAAPGAFIYLEKSGGRQLEWYIEADEDTLNVTHGHGVNIGKIQEQGDTSQQRFGELKQHGIALGGAVGSAMEAIVDDFDLSALSGIPVIFYGPSGLTENMAKSDTVLKDNANWGKPLTANCHIGIDVGAPTARTDPHTDTNTALRQCVDWVEANNAGDAWIFLEAMPQQQAWFDEWIGNTTYQRVTSIVEFRHFFDDAAYAASNGQNLVVKAPVKPADFGSRPLIVLLGANLCKWCGDGTTEAERFERIRLTAIKIMGHAPNLYVAAGGDQNMVQNWSAADWTSCIMAGEIEDTAPTMVSASITEKELTTDFSEPVTFGIQGGTGAQGFTLTSDAAALTVAYVSGSGTAQWKFANSRDVDEDETITLDYTPGRVKDLTGNPLAAIDDFPVTNLSDIDEPDTGPVRWRDVLWSNLYARAHADTGTGGLFNVALPLINSFDQTWSDPDNALPRVVFNQVAERTEEGFDSKIFYVTLDMHVFVEENPDSGDNTKLRESRIKSRLEGDWLDQSSRVPTFGFDRYQPPLSGTGWTASPMVMVGETNQDEEGFYHAIQTYELVVSKR